MSAPRDQPGPTTPLEGHRSAAAMYQAIVETSPLLYCVIDAAGVVAYANPAAELLLGYTPAEIIGLAATDLIHSDDLEIALAALTQIVDHGHGVPGQVPPMAMRVRHRDGQSRILEVGAVDQLANPEIAGIVIRGRAMNGQQMLDQALESLVASSPLDEVLNYLANAMTADLPGSLVSIAHGWNGSCFTTATTTDVPPGLDGVDQASAGFDLASGSPWQQAIERRELVVHPDLSLLPESLRAQAEAAGLRACWTHPVFVPSGDSTLACIIVWRDQTGEPWVSQRVSIERSAQLTALAFSRLHYEEQLQYAALHDDLTGVPNRASFFARLEQVTAEPTPDRRSAVLYLDLDGFKQVNDTYGHGVGDELLRIVTERISASVRPHDLVARLGGDEFAVVCTDLVDVAEAEVIADRLVKAIGEPATIGQHDVCVGLSVGVALADLDGETVAKLVEAADRALYRAKLDGKGRYHVAT